MSKREALAEADFGQRIAEEEGESLSAYFVETDNWRRLFAGDIDIIYGPKGSGKSALYSLLVARTDQLFDKNIILVPAENLRGTPALRDLAIDPPASEKEFVGLWKLYFLTLLVGMFDEYEFSGEAAQQLRDALAREGLIKGKRTLAAMVQVAFDYVKRALRPEALEGGVEFDPLTQMPKGFKGKIIFREPSGDAQAKGVVSVDNLLNLANEALRDNGDYIVWILLDRLDVAFVENEGLEQNALRALFRVYLDLLGSSPPGRALAGPCIGEPAGRGQPRTWPPSAVARSAPELVGHTGPGGARCWSTADRRRRTASARRSADRSSRCPPNRLKGA
jgi:hypothetical protein